MNDDFYIAVNGIVIITAPDKNALVLQIQKSAPNVINRPQNCKRLKIRAQYIIIGQQGRIKTVGLDTDTVLGEPSERHKNMCKNRSVHPPLL